MAKPANELEVIEGIFSKEDALIQKAESERLQESEAAELMVKALFEITQSLPGNKLVEVRDYGKISEVGAFKYSGETKTIHGEGLMPQDVAEGLNAAGLQRHVGPVYLRVKGLLTYHPSRKLFGRQMARIIGDHLKQKPLPKKDGFVICIPNMTGGVWIGDETARHIGDYLEGYKAWPVTPYARETRKAIEAKKEGAKYIDHVEGLMPSPESTSAVICFEELRTSCETTKNATTIHRTFGYNDENKVAIVEACVFDYLHPVGVERLKRLGTDGLYAVSGSAFLDASKRLGYISDSQYQTAKDWLDKPWDFTRKILPDLKRLSGK